MLPIYGTWIAFLTKYIHTLLKTLPRANGIPMEGMFPKQMYIAETFLRAKPPSPSMVPRIESGNTYIRAQNIISTKQNTPMGLMNGNVLTMYFPMSTGLKLFTPFHVFGVSEINLHTRSLVTVSPPSSESDMKENKC